MFSTGKKPKTPGRVGSGLRSSSRRDGEPLALFQRGENLTTPARTLNEEAQRTDATNAKEASEPAQQTPGPHRSVRPPLTDSTTPAAPRVATPTFAETHSTRGNLPGTLPGIAARSWSNDMTNRDSLPGAFRPAAPVKMDETASGNSTGGAGGGNDEPGDENEADSKAQVKVLKHYMDFASSGAIDGALETLRRAGAFDERGKRNAFAGASRSIIDALGKSWTNECANASLVIRGYLADKQRRHARFLEFVTRLRASEELHQIDAFPAILEHSEKIAAAVALREFQNAASDFAQQSAQGLFTPSETDPGQATLAIVRAAGERGLQRQVALSGRDSVEVFYTRVSSIADFFASLTSHAGTACFSDVSEAPLKVQAERVCELMDAAGRTVEAAQKTRDAHSTSFGASTSSPWTSASVVLDGLWTLCSIASDVQTRSTSSNPSLVPLINQRLRLLGEMLLEGYRESLAAAVEAMSQTDIIQARKVYASRRDVLLRAQLKFIRNATEASPGDDQPGQRQAELARVVAREYTYLAAVAKKHGCFEVLADICDDRGDDARLLEYMKADPPAAAEGPFSGYVFERCLERQQPSRLLTFGDQGFGRELGRFLEGRPQLRWMHEIGQRNFSDAADTLASINGPDEFSHVSEDQLRRQLCLEKIARLAGTTARETDSACEKLDRRIALVDLQVESRISPGHPLPPAQLVEELLNGDRSAVPVAFEALSLAGPAFVSNNRGLVERAWLKAASLDDWVAFQHAHVSEGWSDAMYLDELQKTVLCTAAANFYSQDPESSMVSVLPPRNFQEFSNSKWSIKSILSKHASFSIAAEAMLDAVAHGSGGYGVETTEDESGMLLD